MKTVPLDEDLPVDLRHLLSGFDVATVHFMGWSGSKNGELIKLAERRFEVFLTGDKNLRYQQNVGSRKIAIVELPFTRLGALEPLVEKIAVAIHASNSGDYIQIEP